MLEHKHLLLMADIHKPLKDEELTTFWFDDLICKLKMNKLIEPQAVYCDVEGNRGLTCICAIETSHIVLHIWDEPVPAKMQLDIYTCANLDLRNVWNKIRQLEPFNIKYKFYDREKNFILLNDKEEKRIQKNLLSNVWHFAKTMPTIPHWYTRGREWYSLDEFAEAIDLINKNGVSTEWNKKIYKYYYLGDYKYWTMEEENLPSHKHILINRAKI
tara:strand:+ start:1039 stop:1683 length:645 start_codon:yes stop_codon:yes gene_type:complete